MADRFLSGVVWTDENGYARVPLPPYLRRTAPKFRFELIPERPHIHARLVADLPADELTIYTDVPPAKVAWTAILLRTRATPTATKGRRQR